MMYRIILLAMLCLSLPLHAENNQALKEELSLLKKQTKALQIQLQRIQTQLAAQEKTDKSAQLKKTPERKSNYSNKIIKKDSTKANVYHSSLVSVHTLERHPEYTSFYPTALLADNRVVTYIAGTPVVGSPYLGDRPAFDGSDFIVNISSINRDIRLMEQRRRLYQAYESIGYPAPSMPIIAISGKAEPVAIINSPYFGNNSGDVTLGSNEINVAAALNKNVEANIAIAYDEYKQSPRTVGPRINNSGFNLNMGFVNIGNLDNSPFYFTAGQLYVPFGRFSSSMVSSPLTMDLARTKTRPIILGYKSQEGTGPFAAVYGYRSDTSLGKSGVGGANLGYVFAHKGTRGEVGVSYVSSINDAAGMQSTGSAANSDTSGVDGAVSTGTTFGGFGAFRNGNEVVRKTPALDVHATVNYDRYIFTAEWVGVTQGFRPQDLSFNGEGAKPQAVQTEIDMTFRAFNRPSSAGVGYQWSKDALALNLPKSTLLAVFNISIWKDTVESIEYRHDMDYQLNQFANGAGPTGTVNLNTLGTGTSADTLSLQIGVYF